MSDRRAVSAGHLGASSVAAANEPWRVAVGGNRVQSMTIEQIAHAFQTGQLTVRTPLWPPGTSGWQALGNFEQFQLNPAAYGGASQGHLSQFEEADDDPTRMWTGSGDLELELGGMEQMPAPPQVQAPQARPSAQTGPRQVASRAPRPVTVASQPVRYAPAAAPLPSLPPIRQSRGNGLLLVAGLVGLVGLGSAILAARGSWSSAAPPREASSQNPVITADPAPTAATPAAEAAKPSGNGVTAPEASGAQLAKYDDTRPSAFVAEGSQAPGSEQAGTEQKATENETAPAAAGTAAPLEEPALAETPSKSSREKTRADSRQKALAKATPKRAPVVAAAPKAKAEPKPVEAKPEPKEIKEPKEAKESPANASVNEAAAAALATSATLASSCRPSGGPSGAGKARIIYSNEGDVQSVEILTAKFRDTLTGSCVRMVFRRAKIPAFKGEPPTFIKSFTIPDV